MSEFELEQPLKRRKRTFIKPKATLSARMNEKVCELWRALEIYEMEHQAAIARKERIQFAQRAVGGHAYQTPLVFGRELSHVNTEVMFRTRAEVFLKSAVELLKTVSSGGNTLHFIRETNDYVLPSQYSNYEKKLFLVRQAAYILSRSVSHMDAARERGVEIILPENKYSIDWGYYLGRANYILKERHPKEYEMTWFLSMLFSLRKNMGKILKWVDFY